MTQNQGFSEKYSRSNKVLMKRINKTLEFLSQNVAPGASILDLGIPSLLSEEMKRMGYKVTNTEKGLDLDLNYEIVKRTDFDVVTAFEIFEHLVSPFPLLRAIEAPKLIASVPLKLWFAKAYWNANDPWDRHYHEFEDRQFDMLLEKSGWHIKKSEKWVSYDKMKLGIRPILRRFTPRYYIVCCERA